MITKYSVSMAIPDIGADEAEHPEISVGGESYGYILPLDDGGFEFIEYNDKIPQDMKIAIYGFLSDVISHFGIRDLLKMKAGVKNVRRG